MAMERRKPGGLRLILMLMLALAMLLTGCAVELAGEPPASEEWAASVIEPQTEDGVEETGRYTAPASVAAYIYEFGRLPDNFITKKEASALGWKSSEGNLWEVTDRMSIGGDAFGNREGRLPSAAGRKWFECDVNYEGGYRGAERIVYSNDGLIYYTDDHYETFTQLY